MRTSYRRMVSTAAIVGSLLILPVRGVVAAESGAPKGDPETVILTVNGEPVHAWEVSLVMPQIAAGMGRQGQQPNQEQVAKAAAQQVVQTKLLAQEAHRRELEPNAERVAETLQTIETQSGGREALVANLGSSGLTYDQLVATVTETDLVQVLIETELEPKATVTDDEVASYYAANPDRFEVPEQVRARHILFKSPAGTSPEEQEAARAKAEAARARAVAGEDFATLAKELSEGPSGPKGGDLGFFDKSRMVEPFASAAFALKPGEISPVVKTQFGFHVIKVEERKPPGTLTFDEVKPRLEEMLRGQKMQSEVGALLQELGDKAEVVQAGETGGETESPVATPDSGAGKGPESSSG